MLPSGPTDFDRIQRWALDHLTEVVRAFGGVEPNKAGRCRCPIHDGEDLNFKVTDGQGWYCHSGCGDGSDGVEFVRRIKFNALSEKEGRIASLRELAPMAGVVLREKGERGSQGPFRPTSTRRQPAPLQRIIPQAQAPATRPLAADVVREDGVIPQERAKVYEAILDATTLTPKGQQYLASRGFDPGDVADYGLRSLDTTKAIEDLANVLLDSFLPEELEDAGLWNAERRRVSFPFVPHRWGNGALILPYWDRSGQTPETLRFRNLDPTSDERYRSIRGDVPVPFNWGAVFLAAGGELHITEGELNALSLIAHGVYAIGLPGASSFQSSWATPMRDVARLVTWFDNDTGGERGVKKVAAILQAELGRSWLISHGARAHILTDDLNTLHQRGLLHDRLTDAA